jgi:hypothetical protein
VALSDQPLGGFVTETLVRAGYERLGHAPSVPWCPLTPALWDAGHRGDSSVRRPLVAFCGLLEPMGRADGPSGRSRAALSCTKRRSTVLVGGLRPPTRTWLSFRSRDPGVCALTHSERSYRIAAPTMSSSRQNQYCS